jgi:hypothetical protein
MNVGKVEWAESVGAPEVFKGEGYQCGKLRKEKILYIWIPGVVEDKMPSCADEAGQLDGWRSEGRLPNSSVIASSIWNSLRTPCHVRYFLPR